MTEQTTATWRERVANHDPTGHDHMVDYIGHVTSKEAIPEKYRELILFAVSAGVRYEPSARTHAAKALAAGATAEQLTQAVQLAGLSAGFTTVISGIEIVDEVTGG